MKKLSKYLSEKLLVNKDTMRSVYVVNSTPELIELINERVSSKTDFNKTRYLDLSDVDVSNLTSLEYAISTKNVKLIEFAKIINISNWDTSNVINMHCMFSGCKELEKIIGIEDLDISGARDCGFMFHNCSNLKELDLSKWDVSKLNAIDGMFCKCGTLTDLSFVNNWKFSENIDDLTYMFNGCNNIESLDLSGWNVDNVEAFEGMFRRCYELKTIGDISDWKIKNGRFFEKMFYMCEKLTTTGDLNKWKEQVNKNKNKIDGEMMFTKANENIIPDWYDTNNNDIIK